MDLKRWFQFCCINILLLFCTIAVVQSQHQCTPGLDFPGYTIPRGDIAIEYGNPLDIMCVLHNTTDLQPNASQYLTFNRNNHTIPSEMIEIVNSTAIKLHIDQPPKVNNDHYTCLLNRNTSVCMNVVIVGTKPQPVEDFECIGYNFDNLTCKWTPPENYIRTKYQLNYTLSKSRLSRQCMYMCPSMKYPNPSELDQRMSCFWNISTAPQYRQVQPEYNFTLSISNKFGSIVMNFPFQHFAHVLPGPPENLTAISTTPSSILLYWMIPFSMQDFPVGVHHRILYQCEYGEKSWHFGGLITDTRPDDTNMKYSLTKLKYAHALCDIRVSLRSATADDRDESMWSKNASITVRTNSKTPDKPPKTDLGSFEIAAFGSSLEYSEAYIYWQQILDEEKNGPDFKYDIRVEGHPNIHPVEMTNAYAKFVNLSVTNTYIFNIWSTNTNGTSREKSTVVVPRQRDRIKEPSSLTKTEYGDGRYELTWEVPKLRSGQFITNYTIFWCNNDKDRPWQCNGKLNWTVVPGNITGYNGTVPTDTIYQFAISANTHNGSSGMLWAACTVIHNKTVGKMKNVWINRLGSSYIEIGWKLDCSDHIGSVEGYIVYYCPIKSPFVTECKGPQKNVTFYGEFNINSGNVTDLSPYTTYMLTVAVRSKHGSFSQQSDPLYNTTLEAAPSTPPRDFQAFDVTNSTVSLKWLPPTAINGVLKYYFIRYNQSRTGCEQTFRTDNRTITQYKLEGLASYENYSITIQACTTKCSEYAPTLTITTKMGYPSKIQKPAVDRRNDTTISIVWNEPEHRNGPNDYYIIQFKQKHDTENKTFEFNVTERRYVIENCGNGGKFNTFYVSVRAVNVIENRPYKGEWSDELENYCSTPINYMIYILPVVVILFALGMLFLSNKLYKQCKIMQNVEVKLPPGLAPEVTDHKLVPWSNSETHHQETREPRPRPDEELLLVRINEGDRNLSGDSSGCSSGHESVTSSLESGTHMSSSSDSGTEQAGNYCVLGVDPKSDSSYVPVNADSIKSPYKTCEISNESSPYVMTGDVVKTVNPGYIPFNQTEPIGKSSGYVVAGTKNNRYIPFNIKNCKLD